MKRVVSKLLHWFERNARDLPWRRTDDPYAIWVSEIMLQQTQVNTVRPYWERWMRELPTLQALASAAPERLHKLWEGLGYYRRVRHLQQAARIILRRHQGKVPEDFEHLLALPGIGRYTAGAIASIAFDQPRPILDGNIIRVLSRCFAIPGNPRAGRANRRLWQLAEDLVLASAKVAPRSKRPCSRFNQALMELGALVCLPRQPRCGACPLSASCVAHRQGRVETLPNLVPAKPAIPRRFVAVVLEKRGRYLVRRRPAGAVNGNFWEFPNLEFTADLEDAQRTARRAFGLEPGISLEALGYIRHSITRYRLTLEVFRAKLPSTPRTPVVVPARGSAPARWLAPAQVEELPLASAHRKILNRLRQRLKSSPARAHGPPVPS